MTLKQKFRSFLIVLIFFILMLQVGVMNILPDTLSKLLSYFDDALECALIVALLIQFFRGKLRLEKIEYVMLVAIAIFAAFGLISNLVSGYQTPFNYFVDMLTCCRFMVLYLGCRLFLPGKEYKDKILRYMSFGCKVIIVILTVLIVHDLLFEPFFVQDTEYRFSIPIHPMRLFFQSPTALGVCGFLCAATILMAGTAKEKNNISDVIFILLSVACSFMSMRSKTIAPEVIMLVLYAVFCLLKIRIPYILDAIFGAAFAAASFIFGLPRLIMYYSEESVQSGVTRAVMAYDSVKLANEKFPLGTGFGTFGSGVAFKTLPKLYYDLDYPNRLLDVGDAHWKVFTCDTFWPVIIAQTGWIGTALFICVIVCFIILAIKEQMRNPYLFVTMVSIIAYLLIASFGEAIFFAPMMNAGFIIFGMAADYYKK